MVTPTITLPTPPLAGQTGHITHHNALHALYDLADSVGQILVSSGADAWGVGTLSDFTGSVSVKSYGAVGDGVTDDTAAIQAAIDAVAALGGGVVFLPKGIYKFTTVLTLKSNVTVMGTGSASVLKGVFATLTNGIVSEFATGNVNIALRNFRIDRTGTNSGHGLQIRNCVGVNIEGVHFYGSRAFVDGPTALISGALNIGGFGAPAATDTCRDVRVAHCYFEEADNFGIQFGAVVNGVMVGNQAKNCYREVYAVEPGSALAASNITIVGNSVLVGGTKSNSSTPTGAIIVTESSGGSVDGVTVTGNVVENALVIALDTSPGINIQGGSSINVAANTVRLANSAGISIGAAGVTTNLIAVTGNTVIDCNQGVNVTPNGAGIKLRNATQCTVADNIISGALHTHGVEETSSAADNIVNGNLIRLGAATFGTAGSGSQYVGNKTADSDANFRARSGLVVGGTTLASPVLQIDGTVSNRSLLFTTAGVNRWYLMANSTAEGGANAGSDLQILARADDGSALGVAATITRSTLGWVFGGGLRTVAGSNSSPGLSFSGDPDTGVYSAGTNILGLTAGGVLQTTIASALLNHGQGTIASPVISIDGTTGSIRTLQWATAGLGRWQLRTNGTAESGANVGSDLELIRRNDDGTLLGTVLTITRSTGLITTGAGLTLAGNLTLGSGRNIVSNTSTGTKIGTGTTELLSFWNATPVARPSAYTQTYATADKTLAAYTSDPESSTYTGLDNAQAGTPYAKLTDLNSLRAAYETLRIFTEDAVAMLNSVVDDLQLVGLVG